VNARFALALVLLAPIAAHAEDPPVKPVPPPGVAVPEADRRALEDGLAGLGQQIQKLRKDLFDADDIPRAKKLLATGAARARQLASHQAPWLSHPGPTALGYRSDLDGSVQPYGLYVPATYNEHAPQRWRLDTWFHGRNEKLSEVSFIDSVSTSGGQFVRPDAFILAPYGRYCNGSKLAGEADFFEALADVRRRIRVDDDRIVIRGFSLGGASAWHLGAHFASEWAAVAPGAGFAETPEFLRALASEKLAPTWWQEKLWQLYDAPAYVENFRNVATVAYSGEVDKQKQAADLMAKALDKAGVPMVHVIGAKEGHKYTPEAIASLNRLVDALAERGRDPAPRRVSLATPTLKYNRQAWVVVDALGHHWDKATVDAEVLGDGEVKVTTRNVTALTLDMAPARCPFSLGHPTVVRLDGQKLAGPAPRSDRSYVAHFHRAGARWQAGELPDELRKRHDLQGPIDDAFMASFMIVTPSGQPWSREVGKWAVGEQMRAIKEWRRQLRGEPRVRRDTDVTSEDIAAHNLVLWGDPGSNLLLGKIAERLPIQWTREAIVAGKQRFPAETHALLAVYPNPLNPKRYVVLNSGFTFREYDYLNNARQIPRLPDWAVVDTATPPDSRWPGKVAAAGFFGERWELVAHDGKHQ
jgi:dienelactone hydrolase